MATKRTRSTTTAKSKAKPRTKRKRTGKKKRSAERPTALNEPVASRALQAALLIIAALLLFSALVSPRAGPVIVGVLMLFTAFPPIRGPVDEWLTGKRRGKVAEQAAAIRMAAGAAVVLFSLLRVVASI